MSAAERVPDVSADPGAWVPVMSGEAELALSAASVNDRAALRMDFDFKGGGGFVVARRVTQGRMPADYAIRFRLRGRGAANDLELKLIDATGQNVWRWVKRSLQPSSRWKSVRIDSRDIEFAWGPGSGGVLSELGAIELAVVAREGGAGSLWLSDLEIDDESPGGSVTASASSTLPGSRAADAIAASGWIPSPDDAKPWIVLDFGEPRRLGGLIIDWRDGAPAGGFRVRASSSGDRWRTWHAAARAAGARSYVYLPNRRTRFLRLELNAPSAGAALRPQPFEFSRSIEAFWYSIARSEPRGWYPRWLQREQSLWTPVGRSDGAHCALLNEEGAIEMAPASFSIEPMVLVAGRLFTWADVVLRRELLHGVLPVPSAIWETADWCLRVQAEVTGSGVLRVRYGFDNRAGRSQSARLLVLVRPFQVTPPWQAVGKIGGVSMIHALEWEAGVLRVNDATIVVPATQPSGFVATIFDEGFIASQLVESAGQPGDAEVHDRFGFCSGAFAFDLSVQADASDERVVHCVPTGMAVSTTEPPFDWSARLPEAQWSGSGWAVDAINAALTATAHILVTRSGPALQPGPRRYTRSWIRDGSIMSAALLRMGRTEEVRDFIRWYAPYQRADGFVPCLVDRSGPDWLVEHDSHGQLVVLIADYYRFTEDVQCLRDWWTFVVKAVGCIESLLEVDGLLPVSVSHEGYLAQPVHSYWDDFWALRGVRDAVELAHVMGEDDAADRWRSLADRLESALYGAIERTRAAHNLDFIPGSAEWADFDPTATAIAVGFLDVAAGLDSTALQHTFDKYLSDWRRKRTGALEWSNYSPYEIRIIGAFVRLGQREAALELLRFFLSDRRPPEWNQWPEIGWRDPRAPAHLGDLPHTWIAAEYVLAVCSLFAYERTADRTLVLAAAVAPEWLAGAGVRVDRMPTPYGRLSFSVRSLDARTLRVEITAGVKARLELRPPLPGRLSDVTVNGISHADFDDQSVKLVELPAVVLLRTAETS
jgi:hypothetical protein